MIDLDENYIYVDKVSDNVVNYSIDLLKDLKFKEMKIYDLDIFTKNGFQTRPCLWYFDTKILDEMVGKYADYRKIDHLHLIEYEKSGWQKEHTHEKTDWFSFVLYLNDSDGSTVFNIDEKEFEVKPEKGKIIYFSGKIKHKGLETTMNKKVLVGSLKQ